MPGSKQSSKVGALDQAKARKKGARAEHRFTYYAMTESGEKC